MALATPDSTDSAHLAGVGELLVAALLSLLTSDTQGAAGEIESVVVAVVVASGTGCCGTALVAALTVAVLGAVSACDDNACC